MGRTNQVLTGGSIFSTSPQTTTMKIVFALLVLCLFQFSLAELEDVDNAETNLVLERDIREAGKNCPQGKEGKQCRKRQKKRKSRKSSKRGGKKQRTGKGRKLRQRSGKKTGKQLRQKKNGKKVRKQNSLKRQGGARSSSKQRASGRQDTCFADLVAKTKKFNKAQVEFRLAKRVESWGKLMKNKKSNAASTFADALEAMNDATGNGTGCDGDSASLEEAKKVQAKLANCSTSAGDNCDEGKLATPINSTLVSSCKDTLEAFAKDFKDCLTKSSDAEICSCAQGLTNPGDECLDFKTMHDGVKAQKEKCTKGSEEGSFGDCRKQERMAAKFGNKCKQSCPGGSVTTMAPARSQRMKLLRRLNQKLNFH